MFSFILQIFVESLLYADTGVGRKNLVVNETELVSAFVELIGKWRGHDSQLTTEIVFNYFVMRMRRKTQDTMTGRPMCYGYSEKDSLRTYHAGLALRQTDRTTNHQANPCSCLISLPPPAIAILFTRKDGIFSTQAAQSQVIPLHVTVGPVWPALGSEGKSRWPIWANLSVISSPLFLHIFPENQQIAKTLPSE